ncbi:MAG: NADH-quinone oxidoreductase subunit NuoG, partial [Bosea sp. (in: a-proteobacteria)]
SATLGQTLPFDTLAQLRARLYAAHPHLAALDEVSHGDPAKLAKLASVGGRTLKAPFMSPVRDFYLTNPSARASATMAECSALASGKLPLAAE